MTPKPPSSPPRRAAFLVAPHTGGIYTVFRNLRLALQPLAITLDWIGDSTDPDQLRADPAYANELSRGTLIDARHKSYAQICGETVAAVRHRNYDLVFANALTGPAQMSVPAYLPPEIRRVLLVHNITPGTYAAARAVQPYVHATVGVSPRICHDLIRRFRFPANRTFCAPNAIDLAPFNLPRAAPEKTLKLLSVGRVVDADKGVFWLPKIMQRLASLDVHLTIAGDGGDLAELKRRCAGLESRMTFLGRVSLVEMPALFAAHDAMLMPSRFEGFGYTLIESMAQGCVPVASSIRGVTDFVVTQETNGLLFPIGNISAAAAAVCRLHDDRSLLARLSKAGPPAVRDRFSLAVFAASYAAIIDHPHGSTFQPRTLASPPFRPIPIGGTWRAFIPLRVKNLLRNRLMR